MAEGRGEIELYNTWFQVADVDRDGVLSGSEAVQFFLRSGLPQNPTLFKVWQYVAGDRSALSRQEFYTAMKLVSMAQANHGVLDDQQAMRVVNGLAGPISPPSMKGLHQNVSIPSTLPSQPQSMGGPPGSSASSHVHIQQRGGQFPPLGPQKAAMYQTAFEQLDTDKDGRVLGVDCFAAFMRSGLPKSTLKSIWDVVAGNDGSLNRHQFIQSLYLIDCAKSGVPVPSSLPPGQFPPTEGNIGLGSMVDRAGQDIYRGQLHVAPLEPKAVYNPGPMPAVAFQSQVPALPTSGMMSTLPHVEVDRLNSEREKALQQEAERQRLEEQRVAAAARREFFTQTLADLRLAQSKVTRTLVEAQQRLEMEEAEAKRMETQYDAAYESFSTEHAKAQPLLESLKRIENEKIELSSKMAALQTAITQLESYDPEWEKREVAECDALRMEIGTMTVKHEVLRQQKENMEMQRSSLTNTKDTMQTAIDSAKTEIDSLVEEIGKLSDENASTGDGVVVLLQRLAPLYNKLYALAKSALLPLPKEALASIVRPPAVPFKYDPFRFTGGALDWHAFADEGFKITAAIPSDSRLKSLTSPSVNDLDEVQETDAVQETDVVEGVSDSDKVAEAEESMAEEAPVEEGSSSLKEESTRPVATEKDSTPDTHEEEVKEVLQDGNHESESKRQSVDAIAEEQEENKEERDISNEENNESSPSGGDLTKEMAEGGHTAVTSDDGYAEA